MERVLLEARMPEGEGAFLHTHRGDVGSGPTRAIWFPFPRREQPADGCLVTQSLVETLTQWLHLALGVDGADSSFSHRSLGTKDKKWNRRPTPRPGSERQQVHTPAHLALGMAGKASQGTGDGFSPKVKGSQTCCCSEGTNQDCSNPKPKRDLRSRRRRGGGEETTNQGN